MCGNFLRMDPSLDTKITAHGTQPKHFPQRVELACQVHCKKPEGGWSVRQQISEPLCDLLKVPSQPGAQ